MRAPPDSDDRAGGVRDSGVTSLAQSGLYET